MYTSIIHIIIHNNRFEKAQIECQRYAYKSRSAENKRGGGGMRG